MEPVLRELLSEMHLFWDFPDGPVAKALCPPGRGASSIPGWGTKIPRALSRGPKKN